MILDAQFLDIPIQLVQKEVGKELGEQIADGYTFALSVGEKGFVGWQVAPELCRAVPLAILLRAMQYHDLAKVAQIVDVVALVILHDETVNHTCQHGFVNAHKETLQIQFHDVTVGGVIVAGLLDVGIQHFHAIQLTFAFAAVECAWTKHQFKQRL